MTEKKLAAGDPIECRCTKCRKITNHIIVALTDEKPAKVECNTCGGQHKYRSPAAPKKPSTRRAAVTQEAKDQAEWLKRETEIREAKSIPYDMQASFKVGVVIKHPSFGLGLVLAACGTQKIEVLFPTGKKIMRCK